VSKNPKIEHEYHAGKDELKIWVHGYALKSKKTRDKVMKSLCDEVERSPDRLIEDAKTKAKKEAPAKNSPDTRGASSLLRLAIECDRPA
jgi:hypothetical protein